MNFNVVNGLNLPLTEEGIKDIQCITGEKVLYSIRNKILYIEDIIGEVREDTILKIEMEVPVVVPEKGIDVKEVGNRFDRESIRYGSVLGIREFVEEIVLDLEKIYLVTAIVLEGKNTQWLVESSIDGEYWVSRYEKNEAKDRVEVKMERYKAGAVVPGDELRYVKIKTDGEKSCVYVYGL